MITTDETLNRKVLQELWSDTHQKVVDVHNVPVQLRCLYDKEELDCLIKATAQTDPSLQQFSLIRWQLAYSILSVGGQPFEGSVEAKYTEILEWPNIIVRFCIDALIKVVKEEEELITSLGEYGSTETVTLDGNSALIGNFLEPLDSEDGQNLIPDSDELL